MLRFSPGASVRYLTDEVGAGAEGYFADAVDAGEPEGQWWGAGAEMLGLTGAVDSEVMAAIYERFLDPRDPRFADLETRDESARLGGGPRRLQSPAEVVASRINDYAVRYGVTPEVETVRKWQVRAEKEAQSQRAFFDLTFSPDKSVTILHAALDRAAREAREEGREADAEMWAERAAHVEAAVMEASGAGLEYVQEHSYTRLGRHGPKSPTGHWESTPYLTVARFLQHTSRELDPQLHVHQAVLNRVPRADGKWGTVDSETMKGLRAGAGAIMEREMEASLTRRLGVRWEMREDGLSRRVVGIDRAAEELFSSRRMAITERAAQLIAEHAAATGREPTRLERSRLLQDATLYTRPAKSHGESPAEMSARWDAMMRGALSRTLADQAVAVMDRTMDPAPAPPRWDAAAIIAEAAESAHVDGGRPSWSRHDLIQSINRVLPDDLGSMESGDVRRLLDALAAQATGTRQDDVVQVAGKDFAPDPGGLLPSGAGKRTDPSKVRWSTRGHLAAEGAIVKSAGARGFMAVDRHDVESWIDDHAPELSADQRAAVVGLASSDAGLAVLVGPAGTGKTFALGAMHDAWATLAGGRVVGVTTTKIAAEVLADDGVTLAATAASFLGAQGRIEEGRANPADESYRLGAKDVLVVDEASMVDTAVLTRLQDVAAAAGARVVLTGDPAQIGAVGAGGMMRSVVERGAETYTLSEVRRFNEAWERKASLAVRDGDIAAVEEYDARGRIIDGGTLDDVTAAVARAALADRLSGLDAVVVAVSNETAGKVAGAVRTGLVAAGVVAEAGVVLGRDGNLAGVGDVVQARRVDRALGLTNRRTYEVVAHRDDGGLDVVDTGTGKTRVMPGEYLATDAALAYASTAHGVQGRTVDTGHFVLDGAAGRDATYVASTRGRVSNTIWAVTAPDPGAVRQMGVTGRGQLASALTERGGAEQVDRAAIDQADADDERSRSAATLLGAWEGEVQIVGRQRLERILDDLVADGSLGEDDRARLCADQTVEHLVRLIRVQEQAGADPGAVLRDAVTGGPGFADAKSVAQVVSSRITKARGIPSPRAAVIPGDVAEETAEYLRAIGAGLRSRRDELGEQAAADPPAWAVDALGPVPEEATERASWVQRAGTVAAFREATGWDDPSRAVGRCPGVHTPEQRAMWHAAWSAAGMPEDRRAEGEMSEGRLLVRARAVDRVWAHAPAAVYSAQRWHHQAASEEKRRAFLAAANGDAEAADEAAAASAERGEAATRLDDVAEVRAAWLVEHAETIAAGEAALEELARRGIDPDARNRAGVTAEEWLAEHDRAVAVDDAHREVTGTDLTLDLGPTVEPVQTDVDVRAAPVREVTSSASAAEVDAVVAHARVAGEQLADAVSQDAGEHLVADDTAVDDAA